MSLLYHVPYIFYQLLRFWSLHPIAHLALLLGLALFTWTYIVCHCTVLCRGADQIIPPFPELLRQDGVNILDSTHSDYDIYETEFLEGQTFDDAALAARCAGRMVFEVGEEGDCLERFTETVEQEVVTTRSL